MSQNDSSVNLQILPSIGRYIKVSKSSEDKELQRFYIERLGDDLLTIEGLILSYTRDTNSFKTGRELSRQVHSIKGTAGGYGLELVSVLAHRMEDLIALMNLTDIPKEERIDRLLKLKDLMAEAVQAYSSGDRAYVNNIASRMGVDFEINSAKVNLQKSNETHRLLLVDTSDVTLKLCIEALKRFQIEFATEKNGYDALGRLLKERFDSVIISMHSPWLSGPDLAFLIRNTTNPNKSLPITALTSDVSWEMGPKQKLLHKVIAKDQHMSENLIQHYGNLASPKAQEKSAKVKAPFKKVLIVDDSEDIHNLHKLSFKKHPEIELHLVKNPLTTLQNAMSIKPDLILLDAEMPEMSGKEVCKILKNIAQTKNIPVFFITGLTEDEELNELRSVGGLAVVQKPFSPKTFASKLFELFEQLVEKKAA